MIDRRPNVRCNLLSSNSSSSGILVLIIDDVDDAALLLLLLLLLVLCLPPDDKNDTVVENVDVEELVAIIGVETDGLTLAVAVVNSKVLF